MASPLTPPNTHPVIPHKRLNKIPLPINRLRHNCKTACGIRRHRSCLSPTPWACSPTPTIRMRRRIRPINNTKQAPPWVPCNKLYSHPIRVRWKVEERARAVAVYQKHLRARRAQRGLRGEVIWRVTVGAQRLSSLLGNSTDSLVQNVSTPASDRTSATTLAVASNSSNAQLSPSTHESTPERSRICASAVARYACISGTQWISRL